MTDYTFKVQIPDGLHARPCAKIIAILKPFEPVTIVCGPKKLKSLSLLDLLLLKIPCGESLKIVAGPLPETAVEGLEKVFSGDELVL